MTTEEKAKLNGLLAQLSEPEKQALVVLLAEELVAEGRLMDDTGNALECCGGLLTSLPVEDEPAPEGLELRGPDGRLIGWPRVETLARWNQPVTTECSALSKQKHGTAAQQKFRGGEKS